MTESAPTLRVIPAARLADYTTFRIGGPCATLLDCPTLDTFIRAWREVSSRHHTTGEPPPLLIGGGSNLLVADEGIRRTVIRYTEATPRISRENTIVHVTGGTALDDLARITADWGLQGLVTCSGIPGTVGGAIAGNAGAFGEQVGDRLITLHTIDAHGILHEREPESLGFAYRRSDLPARGEIVLSARFQLKPADAPALQERRREILALRAAKHPDWRTTPTAGSFFKNIEPTSNAGRRQAAGWFLEQAGALSMQVGGARPFERHANIIIAEPGCRAQDVIELTAQMSRAVRNKFGLELEPEVKMISDG